MLDVASWESDVRRKEKGIHASCLFDNWRPIVPVRPEELVEQDVEDGVKEGKDVEIVGVYSDDEGGDSIFEYRDGVEKHISEPWMLHGVTHPINPSSGAVAYCSAPASTGYSCGSSSSYDGQYDNSSHDIKSQEMGHNDPGIMQTSSNAQTASQETRPTTSIKDEETKVTHQQKINHTISSSGRIVIDIDDSDGDVDIKMEDTNDEHEDIRHVKTPIKHHNHRQI